METQETNIVTSSPKVEEKMCSHCHKVKPVTEFYKNRTAKDGYSRQCKKCHDATVEKYHTKKAMKSNGGGNSITNDLVKIDDISDVIGDGKARTKRTPLSAYTPRELMLELKARGYTGKLEWTPPKKVVDLARLD